VIWFKASEFACTCPRPACVGKTGSIEPDLGERLDALRSICVFPLTVTSGLRCPEHNAEVGGAPDSAHLTGQAADIECTHAGLRRIIVKAAMLLFDYVEIAPHHVHCDVKERGARLLDVGTG